MNELKHLAIIMDGNGRWAEARGLSRSRGHIAGARRAFELIEDLLDRKEGSSLETVTLFGFSKENWSRPAAEISGLMRLMQHSFESRIPFFVRHGLRVSFIGDREELPLILMRIFERVEEETRRGSGLQLVFAINYSGQWDIRNAIARAAPRPAEFETYLSTRPFGPVDLLVLTGGEHRLSNFLLWPLAYAELAFVDKLWPDFSPRDLRSLIDGFQTVDRRFGRTSQR